ncbi:adhesion G protein-coupled receptor G3 isoform X3 [Acinonyx jubatus]|uniref:Adhesion G protein-coupled receptor G3 isoform X3 n=1 Tax=Acinonyx jubatus TaxID=32536 RepID=A0A6J2AP92_ACIJB|nr:adhesion G protein-coupled receptor G3 isoform X3 [Acinonyx jubatus]
MVTPGALRVLFLLLLLLWASGMENSRILEQPRNVCLGLINEGNYESFHLENTAGCFTKCRQSGNEPCDLKNLQRYWLKYEFHLVENQMGIVNTSFLKAVVQSVSTNISEDLLFSLTPSQVPRPVTEEEHEPPDRVRLPRSLFESLQDSRSVVRLAITLLDIGPGNLFKGPKLSLEDSSSVLNNRLVGLSLGNISVSRLAEPLEITFSHQRPPSNMTFSCVFWDVTKGSTGDWSSTGCSTELSAKRTVCRCDHLTFFALLLRPILDRATVQALIRISQAGCGASMIFLAFTVLLYAALSPQQPHSLRLRASRECERCHPCPQPSPRLGHSPHPQQAEHDLPAGRAAGPCEPGLERQKESSPTLEGGPWRLKFYRQRFKSEDAPKVHVALSISLFLLNLAFFINVGHGREPSDATCWARGAIFHYFLLCTFTWMGLEAFHLYLLVIKVFNTYFGHYFLKLSLVGWGLPALIVIGTGSANSYGHYAIRDKKNMATLELCWFREKTAVSALYVTVHGYFLITCLFSAVVLGLVAWKIFTLSTATAGKEQGPNWKGVLTVLGLSSLVGVTWWLAILTPLGRSTVYVFALFNSLQGVFIFCWFAVLYFPSRTAVASSSGTARIDQVHTASQE